MVEQLPSADRAILDLLRERDRMTVADLGAALEVTATAVRQRLGRLMAMGLIERAATSAGRGRPSHYYRLTAAGRRTSGENFADLAVALWEEVRSIEDPQVRRGLIQRVSRRLAQQYADRVQGESVGERMETLAELFSEREIPFRVDRSRELPVLTALACPYPDLAEQDQSVCAMERMLISDLVG